MPTCAFWAQAEWERLLFHSLLLSRLSSRSSFLVGIVSGFLVLKRRQPVSSSKSCTYNCRYLEINRLGSKKSFFTSMLRINRVLFYSITSRRHGMRLELGLRNKLRTSSVS